MRHKRTLTRVMLGVTLATSLVTLGLAGAQAPTAGQPYTGHVATITRDACAAPSEQCTGTLGLTLAGGQELAFAVTPDTWIMHEAARVSLATLEVGQYVTVQTRFLPGAARRPPPVGSSIGQHPITLDQANTP
jgi:hypothetical protein